jgi:hypothetical protein
VSNFNPHPDLTVPWCRACKARGPAECECESDPRPEAGDDGVAWEDEYAARREDFYCGSDYPGRTGP